MQLSSTPLTIGAFLQTFVSPDKLASLVLNPRFSETRSEIVFGTEIEFEFEKANV